MSQATRAPLRTPLHPARACASTPSGRASTCPAWSYCAFAVTLCLRGVAGFCSESIFGGFSRLCSQRKQSPSSASVLFRLWLSRERSAGSWEEREASLLPRLSGRVRGRLLLPPQLCGLHLGREFPRREGFTFFLTGSVLLVRGLCRFPFLHVCFSFGDCPISAPFSVDLHGAACSVPSSSSVPTASPVPC